MHRFPTTWQCPIEIADMSGALDYMAASAVDIQRSLAERSAILFRGFPLRGPADFGRAVTATGIELWDYQSIGGGGVRDCSSPAVYTTIDDIAPQARQSPHHERARSSDVTRIPSKLALYCETPAEIGGETALCLSESVAERLRIRHPRLFSRLAQNRLRYCKTIFDRRYSPVGVCPLCHQSHVSWQEELSTDSKEEALLRANRRGVSATFHDDDLVRRGELSAYPAISRPSGREGPSVCWTHKMNERPCSEWVEYEDGSIMHYYEQECVRRIAIESEALVQWQAGDFLLIDNLAVQHSKCPHRGERKVYVTMGK